MVFINTTLFLKVIKQQGVKEANTGKMECGKVFSNDQSVGKIVFINQTIDIIN